MPRAGLSADAVVDIAVALIDAGETPLSLTAVAERAGVRTPSLYKHIASLADLDALVAARVLAEFSAALDAAIGEATGVEAARAALGGYRDYARAHPRRFEILPVQPGNDPRLAPTSRAMLERIGRAIGAEDPFDPRAIHAMRLLRSCAEGWTRLESAGGFGEPVDVDESWRVLVDTIAPVIVAELHRDGQPG